MVKFEKKAIGSTPAGLTAATYAGAKKAVIAVETNAIRFTYDGTTAPTSTTGTLAAVGSTITLETAEQITKFSAITLDTASPLIGSNLQAHYENNDIGFRTGD